MKKVFIVEDSDGSWDECYATHKIAKQAVIDSYPHFEIGYYWESANAYRSERFDRAVRIRPIPVKGAKK